MERLGQQTDQLQALTNKLEGILDSIYKEEVEKSKEVREPQFDCIFLYAKTDTLFHSWKKKIGI